MQNDDMNVSCCLVGHWWRCADFGQVTKDKDDTNGDNDDVDEDKDDYLVGFVESLKVASNDGNGEGEDKNTWQQFHQKIAIDLSF